MTPHRFPAAVVSRRTVRSFRARQASPQRHYTNGEGVLTHDALSSGASTFGRGSFLFLIAKLSELLLRKD
jgi:hypothetical protein